MQATTQHTPPAGLTWTLAVSAYLAVMILSGGISAPTPLFAQIHVLASLVMLLAATVMLWRQGYRSNMAALGTALIVLCFILLLAQLVPLPPGVWTSLPGHDIVSKNLELLGAKADYIPLSLAPGVTLQYAVVFLAAAAAYTSAITLNGSNLYAPIAVFLVCAVIGAIMALIQNYQGITSPFYLYEALPGIGTGTFNNRNFFALQMALGLPVLAALVLAIAERKKLAIWVLAPLALFAVLALLTGLAVSGSRTGIVMAMPAILFSVVMVYRARRLARFSGAALGLIGILGGLLVIGQASLVGFLRLTESDATSDLRATINDGSLVLLKTYYAFGSGFGSYVPLYQSIETPDRMQANYINHAHNDWLEMFIEGGIPALVLMVLGVIWLVAMSIRIWRYGNGAKTAPFQTVATIVLPLMLAHSVVDYPLRTPALLVFFAFMCGVMTLPVLPQQARGRQGSGPAPFKDGARPGMFRPTGSATPPTPPRPKRRSGSTTAASGHTSNILRLQ